MNLEEKKNLALTEYYGCNVFNDNIMKERLPEATYKALKCTINQGVSLEASVAEVVANTMKDWAIEMGATHFTHWFQPMTGVTAEKHESFLSPIDGGRIIMEFSGKELIKGEPDASSFPSGGLRATFEARGYTAWDCTSPAFLKEDPSGVTLCIPTAFCSYTGEALDKKTPLLRSIEAVSREALRLLRLLGNTTSTRVVPTVGAEQEYFLIDRSLYRRREDLVLTGRTLFGSKSAKGQELSDHYFGSIKERVASFMNELNRELWKLGIPAKIQHNEVAPAQHEIAPVFSTANIACDHNQLIMETMKKVAIRHGLACLLHEKPFQGINGSGKHNNWSLVTNDGINLNKPGKTWEANIQFVIFTCAVIMAIDKYPELLRLSAANTGNDLRLGANEAPPAIISVYLGEELTDFLYKLANGEETKLLKKSMMEIGVSTLPALRKDTTDRNRTSPFAFTGNKFEFRMVPSSLSIADANIVLNSIVADSISYISEKLEKAKDFDKGITNVIKETMDKHGKILFNGNGYSKEWLVEAESRGLPNIDNTVDAYKHYTSDKAVALFSKFGVYSKSELVSRREIMLEKYAQEINIEALTMLDIAKREIMPSAIIYSDELAKTINNLKATGLTLDLSDYEEMLTKLVKATSGFNKCIGLLESSIIEAKQIIGEELKAVAYRDKVVAEMNALRNYGDMLEDMLPAGTWPLPTYTDLLFNL